MADEQNTGGERQGRGSPGKPDANKDQTQGSTNPSSQAERDRQNRDDPSQAPESGDRE